jgi:hypothetical protein
MFNTTSVMNTPNDVIVPNGAKKLPNPTNYKIVKCKNFEKGKN